MSEIWRSTVWTAKRSVDKVAGLELWEVVNEKGELVADLLREENARVVAQAPAMLRLLLQAPVDTPDALASWLADVRAVLLGAAS